MFVAFCNSSVFILYIDHLFPFIVNENVLTLKFYI